MIKRPSSLRLLKMVRQSTDDRASILESTPWLLDLTYRKIRDIAYYMEGYALRDGNILFEEGDKTPLPKNPQTKKSKIN